MCFGLRARVRFARVRGCFIIVVVVRFAMLLRDLSLLRCAWMPRCQACEREPLFGVRGIRVKCSGRSTRYLAYISLDNIC